MRITRNQLRQLIKEALEIHHAPEDLEDMSPEEAYGMGFGMGFQSGKPDDPDLDDDGFLSVAELVDMVHRIADDVSLNESSSEELRTVRASRDGQVTFIIDADGGNSFKEGDTLVSIGASHVKAPGDGAVLRTEVRLGQQVAQGDELLQYALYPGS